MYFVVHSETNSLQVPQFLTYIFFFTIDNNYLSVENKIKLD